MSFKIGAIYYPILNYLLENKFERDCKNLIATNKKLYQRSYKYRVKISTLLCNNKILIGQILKKMYIDYIDNYYDCKILVLEFTNNITVKISRQYLDKQNNRIYNIINYKLLQSVTGQYIHGLEFYNGKLWLSSIPIISINCPIIVFINNCKYILT